MKTSQIFAAALLAASVAAPAMAADAVHGKQVFAVCGYCHGAAGAGGAVGPTLKGIIGKKAGTTPGFAYSAAMKSSGITWTEPDLAAFIAKPQAKVKGNRMVFAGLSKPADVADVIAYIKTIN